jgi:phosphomethylpyrimidine synthase
MKITEDVRKYAAEHDLTSEKAIENGLREKSREFVEQGYDVYAKT